MLHCQLFLNSYISHINLLRTFLVIFIGYYICFLLILVYPPFGKYSFLLFMVDEIDHSMEELRFDSQLIKKKTLTEIS